LNRKKRGEGCPRRVVAGELAERGETDFGKWLRMPGIFLEGIQVLSLETDEGVICEQDWLLKTLGIV
jgi:hypothetical protein